MTDTVRLTYRELAEQLGIAPDSARIKAKRHVKSGRWKLIPGNHPGATATVELPVEDLVRGVAPVRTPERTDGGVPMKTDGEIQALKDHIATLRELLEQKNTAQAADQARLIEEREAARAEADQAKANQVRMARDVAVMFDELKALADRHADLHAARARLQAELDQARAELAKTRRPWWHRWKKR